MANWVIDAGKWFAPMVDLLWKYSFKEPVMNIDETGIKVLKIDGKASEKKCQMWICATIVKSQVKHTTIQGNRMKKSEKCVIID